MLEKIEERKKLRFNTAQRKYILRIEQYYLERELAHLTQINELLKKPQYKGSEDKSVLTDEQIEQMAEKLYPTPEHPFDKNDFKERIGFIKGLKYNGSEDKIGKAIKPYDQKIDFWDPSE